MIISYLKTKTLKGVSKTGVEKEITHDIYLNTVKIMKYFQKAESLRSFSHQLNIYEPNKKVVGVTWDG